MYGHNDHQLLSNPYTNHNSPLVELTTIPSDISPQLFMNNIFPCIDSTGLDPMMMTYNNDGGSSSSDYISPTGVSTQDFLQRSVSSHSLLTKSTNNADNNNGWFQRMGLVSEAESDSNLMRRVFSTGDLQTNIIQRYSRSESPLSSESSSIIESMSKAYPYSPEEKKERIERYRSKRSQRNFTKKIKYACRKTLADSRPRVRGRFARNDEIEKNSQSSQWGHEGIEEDYEDDDNWLNFIDSFSANLIHSNVDF